MILKLSTRTRGPTIVRVFADIAMINLALLMALSGRALGLLWSEAGKAGVTEHALTSLLQEAASRFLIATVVLTPLFLASFAAHGFYTFGRAYTGRFRAFLILQAVTLPYLVFGAGLYLFFDLTVWFPRSVWLAGWVLTIVFVGGLRIGSQLWREAAWAEAKIWGRPPRRVINNVLVIGGAGYLGSVVVRDLLERGYQVMALDSLMFGDESVRDLYGRSRFEFIDGDLRNVESVVRSLQYTDAVVHLGAIVGDPASDLDNRLTEEINVAATRMIAEAAKGFGIQRFVFASTCSVYGSGRGTVDESSPPEPISLYARTKLECEQVLLALEDDLFSPVVLRLATLYGMSPRPRFDLVLNFLTAKAVNEGEITIFGGDQWRPLLHVRDAGTAIVQCVEGPVERVKGEVFNVGSDSNNHTLTDLGNLIAENIGEVSVRVAQQSSSEASYRVGFRKIHDRLGFEPQFTVTEGILEIQAALQQGRISDYGATVYSNAKTLQAALAKSFGQAYPYLHRGKRTN